jgi:hypothetical protein
VTEHRAQVAPEDFFGATHTQWQCHHDAKEFVHPLEERQTSETAILLMASKQTVELEKRDIEPRGLLVN